MQQFLRPRVGIARRRLLNGLNQCGSQFARAQDEEIYQRQYGEQDETYHAGSSPDAGAHSRSNCDPRAPLVQQRGDPATGEHPQEHEKNRKGQNAGEKRHQHAAKDRPRYGFRPFDPGRRYRCDNGRALPFFRRKRHGARGRLYFAGSSRGERRGDRFLLGFLLRQSGYADLWGTAVRAERNAVFNTAAALVTRMLHWNSSYSSRRAVRKDWKAGTQRRQKLECKGRRGRGGRAAEGGCATRPLALSFLWTERLQA